MKTNEFTLVTGTGSSSKCKETTTKQKNGHWSQIPGTRNIKKFIYRIYSYPKWKWNEYLHSIDI